MARLACLGTGVGDLDTRRGILPKSVWFESNAATAAAHLSRCPCRSRLLVIQWPDWRNKTQMIIFPDLQIVDDVPTPTNPICHTGSDVS